MNALEWNCGRLGADCTERSGAWCCAICPTHSNRVQSIPPTPMSPMPVPSVPPRMSAQSVLSPSNSKVALHCCIIRLLLPRHSAGIHENIGLLQASWWPSQIEVSTTGPGFPYYTLPVCFSVSLQICLYRNQTLLVSNTETEVLPGALNDNALGNQFEREVSISVSVAILFWRWQLGDLVPTAAWTVSKWTAKVTAMVTKQSLSLCCITKWAAMVTLLHLSTCFYCRLALFVARCVRPSHALTTVTCSLPKIVSLPHTTN